LQEIEPRDKQHPILSVIIPTRNRFKYVTSTVKSILDLPDPDFELIVEDNSDNDEVEIWIRENIDDSRLSYAHTTDSVSMSENYDRGTIRSTGEYLAFIGDDDGVLPDIVAATRWAKKNGYDAILPTTPGRYTWPDTRYRYYGGSLAGTLAIAPFTGAVSYPDPQEQMTRCARSGGQDFADLPKIYYGIVRRDCLDQVRAKAGAYFPGPSPDLAGAMAVANYVKTLCKVDYPLFLPGTSGGSNAGLGAMKKHVGRLEDQKHLSKECVDKWSVLVPRFYSGNTIWGEDVVQALRAIERDDVLSEFNVPLLHAMCMVFNPGHASMVMSSLYGALRSSRRNYILGTVQFGYGCCYTWALRFQSLFRRLTKSSGSGKLIILRDIGNIEQAVRSMVRVIAERGRSFDPDA